MILEVTGIFIVIYLLICWALTRRFVSPKRTIPLMPDSVEEALVMTEDGPNPTWVSPNLARFKKIFILIYGYGADRGVWDGVVTELQTLDFGVAVPAMPGQDASPAKTVGFGPKESKVVVATAEFVRLANPNAEIIGLGVSLGGAALWLASELKPDLFSAIITEAAFGKLRHAVNCYLNYGLPFGAIILQPMFFIAAIVEKIAVNRVRPIDSALLWRGKRGLIIHDEMDRLFPKSNTEGFAVNSGLPLWTVPGASHADGFGADPKLYIEKITSV